MIHSKTKADVFSYLRPVINELETLQKKPLRVSLNGKLVATSNVTMMNCVGDGVQLSELMHHYGHQGYYGCRYCLTEGERREDVPASEKNRGGIYFVKRDQELRSYKSLIGLEKRKDYVRKRSLHFCIKGLSYNTYIIMSRLLFCRLKTTIMESKTHLLFNI